MSRGEELREKGAKVVGRVGREGGAAKEPASQCARVCQNYPLAIYPLVSRETRRGPEIHG